MAHNEYHFIIMFQFQNNRTSLTSVYGHQSKSQEIYYQQRGHLSHQAIPPSPSDFIWLYDQQLRGSKTKAILDGEIVL